MHESIKSQKQGLGLPLAFSGLATFSSADLGDKSRNQAALTEIMGIQLTAALAKAFENLEHCRKATLALKVQFHDVNVKTELIMTIPFHKVKCS